MARALPCLVGAATLLLAGCGGATVADPIDEGEIQVTMDAQNDSNVVGVRAVLTYVQKNKTRVLVDGAGPGEPSTGGRMTAHIRRGTCSDGRGAGAFDLGRLQNGATTRTIGVGLPELLAGEYSVDVVSASVGVIACGELPDRLPS